MGISAGIAAVGVIGGMMSSDATKSAAQTQANAANNANATQWGMYNQNQTNLAPYMQAGQGSAQALSDWNAPGGQGSQQFNYQDYLNSPAMAFQMQQGQLALDRSAASRGVAMTPGTAQSESAYNQGVGSQYYQQAFNNFQTGQTNRFNQLSAVAGMGENAAAQQGNNGLQTANIMGQNTMNAANGSAASQIANANQWTGTLNNGVNALSNQYMMQNLMGQSGSGAGNLSIPSYNWGSSTAPALADPGGFIAAGLI